MLETLSWAGMANPVSAVTHLLGAGLFALLGRELLQRGHGNRARIRALQIYISGVVFALTASGLLHITAEGSKARAILGMIDHAGIFFLIAATYTPIHVIEFRGWMRYGALSVVWSLAIGGVALKIFFLDELPEWLSLSLYLGLGWAGLISATALYRLVGFKPLRPLVIGALAYTTGALLDYLKLPNLIPGVLGPHEVFHLFVLTGVSAHWLYIRRITVSAPITDLYQQEDKQQQTPA